MSRAVGIREARRWAFGDECALSGALRRRTHCGAATGSISRAEEARSVGAVERWGQPANSRGRRKPSFTVGTPGSSGGGCTRWARDPPDDADDDDHAGAHGADGEDEIIGR
jgi:hypothetical protein